MKKLAAILLALCLCVLSVSGVAEAATETESVQGLVLTQLADDLPLGVFMPETWTRSVDENGYELFTNGDGSMELRVAVIETTTDDLKARADATEGYSYLEETINEVPWLLVRSSDWTGILAITMVGDNLALDLEFTCDGAINWDQTADICTILNTLYALD